MTVAVGAMTAREALDPSCGNLPFDQDQCRPVGRAYVGIDPLQPEPAMTTFNQPIRKLARANTDFRRVVATGAHAQVVLMCLQPGEDIGEEVHADTDQLFLVVKGKAEATLDGMPQALDRGSLLLVPAGVRHNMRNDGDKRLRLVTFYAPPHHADGTVHATRDEASRAEHRRGRHPRAPTTSRAGRAVSNRH
jgi:mannose-6-phosphate isomerase-like protein (cupin superfamily)